MSTGSERVVVVPPPAGSEHVVCGIWRSLDAAGGAPVASAVPANVYACLNIIGEGSVCLAGTPAPRPAFLCGPMTRPLPTTARGPLRSASIVLQPWLLRDWFGIEPADLVDGWIATSSLGAATAALLQQAMPAAGSPQALAQALERLGAPASGSEGPRLCAALAAQDGVAAAAQALGISERTLERRFRRATGLAPARWLRITRYERSLLRLAQGEAPLADVAAETGYADQAHMNRDFRSVAARTPAGARDALAAGAPGSWPLQPAAQLRRARP